MSIADRGEPIGASVPWLRSPFRRYALAVLAVVAAITLTFGLRLLGPLQVAFILFYPTIVVVAMVAGLGPGILASALAAAAGGYFFLEPRFSFTVRTPQDVVGPALFAFIGVFLTILTHSRTEAREALRTTETDQKRYLERLQEYERTLEGLEEMIVVVDRDYRYVIANHAYLKHRGMKKEQVVGRTVSELVSPAVFEAVVKARLDECFRGQVAQYEMRCTYPSLGERDLFVSYFPIEGPGGVNRAACVLQDVTEKKRAAEELRASEDRYRDLIEHSEDLVCTHDLAGNLISFNPAPARVLGYEVGELLNIPLREIIAPEFREQFDAYLARIKATGVDKGLMCVLTRSGERRIWDYNNTLRTEGVASPIVRGMAHDVTERKRAEQALRRREEDYGQFVARSSEGIFREDLRIPVPIDLPEEEVITRIRRDAYVTECNDALARMYGFGSAQEMIGKRLADMLVPDDSGNLELMREYVRCGFRVLERASHEVDRQGNAKVFLNSMIGVVEDSRLVRIWGIQRDATERVKSEQARKKAEEALQASELRLRTLIEEGPVAIAMGRNAVNLYGNPAFRKMFGYQSAEEVIGCPIAAYWSPEDGAVLEKRSRLRSLGEAVPSSYEGVAQRKDGTRFEAHIDMAQVDLPDGPATLAFLVDISERRQAEEALRESEERFRTLCENSAIGLYRTTPDGKILVANPSLVKMLGFSSFAELSQRNLEEEGFAPGYERAEFQCRLASEEEVKGLEASWTKRDGTAIIVRESAKAIRNAEGEIAYYEGTVEDITEHKRAEEALRQSDERFRVALKDSPITVFNQDRELRYTWVYNPRLYLHQEVVGKTDDEIIGSEKAARLVELKRRVLETGKAARGEVQIPHNGRNYSFDLTVEPLFDAQQNIVGITGASMDIARLRELADSLQKAKDRLVQEKRYLESEIQAELGFEKIIGQSPALREVLKDARVVAPTDSTVLLLGETGTGKELVARAMHSLSARQDKNFIKLNCAAVPTGLLESELFGHEKGAFTSAVNQKIGRLELADKGTLFLDEIGELPLELQPKLLRVLQDREFERLGGVRTLRVDVRVISATNRDLRKDVAEKRFREDLFYRLNVFPILMPALRERRSDIPALVHHFVQKYAARMGKRIDIVPDETMSVLENWSWPGNIRELENMIERMVILTKGEVLAAPPVELDAPQELSRDDLKEMGREHIIRILHETNGVLSGEDGAASRLGIKRTTLQSMLKRFGIEPEEFRHGTGTFGRD